MVAMPPDAEKESPSKFCFNITKREWLILAALTSVGFSSGICVSIQGPVYPQEAEKKGLVATEYGMVFGIYSLVSFVVCPIYGRYMDKIGAKFLVNCGMTVAALCSILFGLMEFIDSHWGFLTLSFVLRIVESIGTSAAFIASFAITAMVFSKNIASMYALLECSFGLGFVLGPTIGGYLFEVGGFLLPFAVVGCVLLLDALFLFFALPNVEKETKVEKPQVPLLSVLKLVPVLLDCFSVFAAHVSVGFNMATMEPHLRQFDISKDTVGAIFAISATTYLLSTPLIGRLCDYKINTKKIIIVGSLLIIIGFSIIGPLPYVALKPSLCLVYLGLVLHGLGMSCIVIPGFIGAINSAVRCGLPDDITTYSVVTGISTASVNLGTFVGPTIAGVLFDLGGYRKSTLFVIVIHVVLMLAMVVFLLTEKRVNYCIEKSDGLQNQTTSTTQIVEDGTDTERSRETEK